MIFWLGFIWVFILTIQTRIVACNNSLFINGLWSFITSAVWMGFIKSTIFAESVTDMILYALGTSLGSAFAILVHSKVGKFLSNKNKHK